MRTTILGRPRCALTGSIVAFIAFVASAHAQNPGQFNPGPVGQGDQRQQPQLNAVLDGLGLNPGWQGGDPNGGGSAQADFDSLIDLIISTVEHDSWQENGTGEGQIMPFDINGVYVNANRALTVSDRRGDGNLAAIRRGGGQPANPNTEELNARKSSPLRYVSLPRLEAAIALQQRRRLPLEPAMLSLAGLQRIGYVLVYPETGDLVLAGPAGDWRPGPAGSIVSADAGRPITRLDDLAALWRRQRREHSAPFGCSIIPREEALARTQAFLNASAAEPIEPSERRQWLEELRKTLGSQDVAYYHVDPSTRIARLLLAADYHMKLVGMGLADSVPGVESYLDTVRLQADGSPPAMSVLRWWFSMPKVAVEATAERDAFALPAQCVEVLSENELLAAQGKRIHTGQSDELNARFARSFTEHFDDLAQKYPVYGELARLFELSLALTVIEREGLVEQVGWRPSLLVDDKQLRLPAAAPLMAVETVVNHRVIGGRHIIAGISGGVSIDGGKALSVVPASSAHAEKLRTAAKQPAAIVTGAGDARQIVWWWD
jgi:hypothetical protein